MADKKHTPAPDERVVLAHERSKRTGGGHDPVHDKKEPRQRMEMSAQEEYLYGRGVFDAYNVKPNWASSTQGRMTIRLVSRGIFGAFAFAISNRYASRQLRDYEPDTFKWGEVKLTEKPLQYVAYGFDSTVGRGIKQFVQWVEPVKGVWSEEVVRFRPRTYVHTVEGQPTGRSLGAEIVGVTFDFSMMSWFDGLARNVIQAIDPNMIQPWYRDKDGNATTRKEGKFSLQHWGKSVGHSLWRITTKNAGEDWAVALPYVYHMKWQRNVISGLRGFDGKLLFPGFKNSADRNRNGGNLVINRQGNIVGDHQLAGVIDLQGRFVMYNVYTLMYREAYDALGRVIIRAYRNGFRTHFSLPKDPLGAMVDCFGYGGRYLIKSFIKANLFMQPAVPFFWIFRVPQSKWKSEIMLQHHRLNQNPIGTWQPQPNGTPEPGAVSTYRFPYPMKYSDWVRATGGRFGGARPDHFYFSDEKVPFPQGLKDPKGLFQLKNCPTLTSKILNPFGWLSYNTGTQLSRLVDKIVPMQSGVSHWLAGTKNLAELPIERTVFLRNYVDAAYAYTPYFIAKDEFGLRVNDSPSTGENGKMDKAIYGLIDNVFTFRFKKAGASLAEIYKLATDLPGQVNYQEGKKLLHEEEYKHHGMPRPKEAAPVESNHGKPKEKQPVQPIPMVLKPSTKVEAVTVQYNVPPPTHLKHGNATQATAKQEGTWAQSMQTRAALDQLSRSDTTLH